MVNNDTIITPNGQVPLAGSTWFVTDQSTTRQSIPTYAIVLAIIFALACLLGLLFLLIKEEETTGFVEIRVQKDNFFHMTQIPAIAHGNVTNIRYQIGQIQTRVHQLG